MLYFSDEVIRRLFPIEKDDRSILGAKRPDLSQAFLVELGGQLQKRTAAAAEIEAIDKVELQHPGVFDGPREYELRVRTDVLGKGGTDPPMRRKERSLVPCRLTRRVSRAGGFMRRLFVVFVAIAIAVPCAAAEDEPVTTGMNAKAFKGLEFRSIGPALMSGRIADIAIHPTDFSTWYVAVGSGGVWKTTNSGTTWTPIFDDQPSYSIGCVVLDPSNPEIVWVGTGENVGGRHVGFGDGVYKSLDGGSSWKNMGLTNSQHISEIIVDPTDSNTVYVASQGPLWSPGGERGLYKTTDGGATWSNILSAGQWTGVTDVVMDPRDPKVLYAATWQHHRTVAALIDGGPESGISKTDDGGATWSRLETGLPKGNMGKIGLAMSPQNPDVVYAVIELDNREGGGRVRDSRQRKRTRNPGGEDLARSR